MTVREPRNCVSWKGPAGFRITGRTAASTPAMPLDLLLLAAEAQTLQLAARRGFWGPLALPGAQSRCLTHLAVLPPNATAIEQVAQILSIEPWPMSEANPRWLLSLGPARQLRRTIPLGRGPQLSRWRPRTADQLRVLSIDGLLLSDSLADYLRRLERGRLRLALKGDGAIR